ncbi:hypothetical protein P0G10_19015, partial [Eubacteriales bacterium DFI.9.88]|nr:hypothetical protein [Eubacteriales bacterium DFI.9.88]
TRFSLKNNPNQLYKRAVPPFYKGDIFSSEFLSQKETFSQVIDNTSGVERFGFPASSTSSEAMAA